MQNYVKAVIFVKPSLMITNIFYAVLNTIPFINN